MKKAADEDIEEVKPHKAKTFGMQPSCTLPEETFGFYQMNSIQIVAGSKIADEVVEHELS